MGNVWAVLGWFAHGHLAEFSLQGGTKLAHAEERLNPIFDYSFRSHVCPWPSTRAAGHFWNEESISHVWRIEFGIYPHSPIADYQDLRRFKEVRAIWMFTSMLSWHVQAPCGCFKLPIGPIMILLQNGLVYYGDLAVGLDPWLNKKNRRCHDYLGYGSISKKNAQKKQIFWSFRVWTIQFRSILHNFASFDLYPFQHWVSLMAMHDDAPSIPFCLTCISHLLMLLDAVSPCMPPPWFACSFCIKIVGWIPSCMHTSLISVLHLFDSFPTVVVKSGPLCKQYI